MRRSIYGMHVLAAATMIAVSVVPSACGTMTASDPFAEQPVTPEALDVQGTPDKIVRSEIQARSTDHTAMMLIRRLRPAWLRSRGQKSFTDEGATYPVVYIDDVRHGALSTLHAIPASEIMSMHFIGTADATTRWGTGHPSGVINIVTGR